MAKRAETVYKKNISYGFPTVSGHWVDRIPSFNEDIADMKNRIENLPVSKNNIEATIIENAINLATSKPMRPSLQLKHKQQDFFQHNTPLSINIEIENNPKKVVLHYRHVNQSEYWQSFELQQNDNLFSGEIPAAYTNNRFPLQYYFEIQTSASQSTLYPELNADLANVPYFLILVQNS
jgi:hypothetical protein